MPVTVTINGKNERIGGKLTIAELLQKKNVRMSAVVVKLNQKIVDKKDYDLLQLKDGDKLEYLYYMGGGY